MIPKRYLRKNKRMSWSYIMDRNGNIRPQIIKMGFNPSLQQPLDLYKALMHLFPYKVLRNKSTMLGDGATGERKELDQWFETHLSNAWQLWSENTEEGIKEVFYFETEADCLHFKLRWG